MNEASRSSLSSQKSSRSKQTNMSAQQVLEPLMLTPQSSIERAKSIRAVCFQHSSDLQAALSSSAPPAPLSGFDVSQVPLSCSVLQCFPSSHLLIRLFCISSSHHLKMCPSSRRSSIFAFFFFQKNKNKTLQVHPRDGFMPKSISSFQHFSPAYFQDLIQQLFGKEVIEFGPRSTMLSKPHQGSAVPFFLFQFPAL